MKRKFTIRAIDHSQRLIFLEENSEAKTQLVLGKRNYEAMSKATKPQGGLDSYIGAVLELESNLENTENDELFGLYIRQ